MPLEVKLRIVMNENARGEKIECIESEVIRCQLIFPNTGVYLAT